MANHNGEIKILALWVSLGHSCSINLLHTPMYYKDDDKLFNLFHIYMQYFTIP